MFAGPPRFLPFVALILAIFQLDLIVLNMGFLPLLGTIAPSGDVKLVDFLNQLSHYFRFELLLAALDKDQNQVLYLITIGFYLLRKLRPRFWGIHYTDYWFVSDQFIEFLYGFFPNPIYFPQSFAQCPVKFVLQRILWSKSLYCYLEGISLDMTVHFVPISRYAWNNSFYSF